MMKIREFYGQNEHQYGDLRLPPGGYLKPIVVIIHGGFWYSEYGLDLMDAMADKLIEHGYATWNIEYRRIGDVGGGYPNTLLDAGEALDFVRTLALNYPLNLNRIVVVGHSAGGHLATWVAARHKIDESSPLFMENPLAVSGVVSLAGVVDFSTLWPVRPQPLLDLLQGTPEQVPNHYHDASPINLVPLDVVQCLIHGTLDDRVPIEVSEAYLKKANAVHDLATLRTLEGVEHFRLIDPEDKEVWPIISDEIDRLMGTE